MAISLIVVDAQYDFVSPSGSLSAPGGEVVLREGVNKCLKHGSWDVVIKTRDYHPEGHSSFKEQGGPWPIHCVESTLGATFHPELAMARAQQSLPYDPQDIEGADEVIVSKGRLMNYDSFSGFGSMWADRRRRETNKKEGKFKAGDPEADPLAAEGEDTHLHLVLQERAVDTVFVCGFVTEYCVQATAIDAAAFGYKTYLISDACCALNTNDGKAVMDKLHKDHGIEIITSDQAVALSRINAKRPLKSKRKVAAKPSKQPTEPISAATTTTPPEA